MSIEPRTAVVTLFTGDYLDRIRHLERLAVAAKEADDGLPRLNSDIPEYVRIAEEHEALVQEARESAIDVRVRAVPRRVLRALMAAHPPRDGNRGDALLGFSEPTFSEALVRGGEVDVNGAMVLYRTIIEPDWTPDEIDDLPLGDFTRIWLAAYDINFESESDPKGSLVSRLTQTSDETSS